MHRTARYLPPKVAVRLSRTPVGRTLIHDIPVTIAWGSRDVLMNDNPELVAHVLRTGSDD
ncbi:MAG: hypothetical protein ACRDRW_00160 [Pseudonocardiaceae bacterium]